MRMRNILVDKNLLNRDQGANTISARHNGYVSTNLIRLLVEAMFVKSSDLQNSSSLHSNSPDSEVKGDELCS